MKLPHLFQYLFSGLCFVLVSFVVVVGFFCLFAFSVDLTGVGCFLVFFLNLSKDFLQ